MFVYSGVLTAVTLGVVPLFLGLTVVASPTCMIIHSTGLITSSDYLKAGWKLFIISIILLFLITKLYWPLIS